VNLRIARDARPRDVAQIVVAMFRSEFASKFGALRTRPNEAHLATQDIPQLRQFVETRPSQVITDAGAPRIARDRPDRTESGFCIFMHGAKFDECECSLLKTNSNLPVQGGPAIGKTNCNCDNRECRGQNNECGSGYNYIERSLGKTREAGQRLMRSEIR
jgi:hypothetical protein